MSDIRRENPETSGTEITQKIPAISETRELGWHLTVSSATQEKPFDPRKPERKNQDRFLLDEQDRFFGVFDGVGGNPGGEVAAEVAKNVFSERAHEFSVVNQSRFAIETKMKELLSFANSEVILQGTKQDLYGMATTVLVTHYWTENGKKFVTIGKAGDSRAYLQRGGQLKHLTLDDNVLKFQVLDGTYTVDQAIEVQQKMANMTEKYPINSPDAVLNYYLDRSDGILDCLGKHDSQATVFTQEVRDGDQVLLATDGCSYPLVDKNILEILQGPASDKARALVDAAAKAGADENNFRRNLDDRSAVVVEV